MKVSVDAELCQGHRQCNLACPEVCQFDDQGLARIVAEQPESSLESALQRAEANRPERAISLEPRP
jgi:ferredoxin